MTVETFPVDVYPPNAENQSRYEAWAKTQR